LLVLFSVTEPEESTLKTDKFCVHDVEIKSTLIDWIESTINKVKKVVYNFCKVYLFEINSQSYLYIYWKLEIFINMCRYVLPFLIG